MNHRKTSNTSQFIEELRLIVEQHLQQAISVYQNLPQHALDKPAKNGGWSITQCIEHLNSYSRYYLPLLTAAVNVNPKKPVSIVKRGWLGNYFIKMMDPDLKTAKYKALKQHLPSPQLDAHKVIAEFIEHQENLLKLLTNAALTDMNNIRIPTSMSKAIRLKLGDTFAFIIMHNERHIKQSNQNIMMATATH